MSGNITLSAYQADAVRRVVTAFGAVGRPDDADLATYFTAFFPEDAKRLRERDIPNIPLINEARRIEAVMEAAQNEAKGAL